MAQKVHVRFEKGAFRFSGECASCHSTCHAVCCRTVVVPLSREEIASGRYQSVELQGLTVLKRNDDGCVYLDGNRCSIYAERPLICKRFDCTKERWVLSPEAARRTSEGMPWKEVRWKGKTFHFDPPSKQKS